MMTASEIYLYQNNVAPTSSSISLHRYSNLGNENTDLYFSWKCPKRLHFTRWMKLKEKIICVFRISILHKSWAREKLACIYIFKSMGSRGENRFNRLFCLHYSKYTRSHVSTALCERFKGLPKGQAESDYLFWLQGLQVCIYPEALISAESWY